MRWYYPPTPGDVIINHLTQAIDHFRALFTERQCAVVFTGASIHAGIGDMLKPVLAPPMKCE